MQVKTRGCQGVVKDGDARRMTKDAHGWPPWEVQVGGA